MKEKNKNIPAISVILPVYNCEAYIKESVESILKQTFTDYELIIINDGSTDSTGDILRQIAKNDPRIILVERGNKGLIFSLNEGIKRSRAQYIARMDADDIAMPDRFKLQYARLNADYNLAVLGTAVRTINSDGKLSGIYCHLITPEEIKKFCEEDCPVIHPTVMMRKEAVVNVGGYRLAYQHCEDFDLWLRILDKGYDIANLPKPLLSYRTHVSNISRIHSETQRFNAIVARLSHRMRKAGLPDPTLGHEKIDSSILNLFPAHIKNNLNALFFTVRNSDISSKNKDDINLAWREYQCLEDRRAAKSESSGFLIRLIYGALRNKEYIVSIKAAWELVLISPAFLLKRMFLRAKISGLIRISAINVNLK